MEHVMSTTNTVNDHKGRLMTMVIQPTKEHVMRDLHCQAIDMDAAIDAEKEEAA
jgi:hypothetical protein